MDLAPPACTADGIACGAITASEVARGVARLFHARDWVTLREVPLPDGRRADMQAVGPCGRIAIVEIKVSIADLRADLKWPDYLNWCDCFYWAVPPEFPVDLLKAAVFAPDRAGLIVADAYEGVVIAEPADIALAAARRRAQTLRFARRAGSRLMALADPALAAGVFA